MDGAAQSVIDVPPYGSASVSVDAAFRDDSLGAMKSTTHSVWRFRIIVSIGWAYLG